MRALCEEAGIRMEYRESGGALLVFHRNDAFAEGSEPQAGDAVPDSASGTTDPVVLSRSAKRTLEIIKENPHATAATIADSLNVTDRTAKRLLKELKDRGAIERQGSDKTGTWQVSARLQ